MQWCTVLWFSSRDHICIGEVLLILQQYTKVSHWSRGKQRSVSCVDLRIDYPLKPDQQKTVILEKRDYSNWFWRPAGAYP
jgi:hypothetical protein